MAEKGLQLGGLFLLLLPFILTNYIGLRLLLTKADRGKAVQILNWITVTIMAIMIIGIMIIGPDTPV